MYNWRAKALWIVLCVASATSYPAGASDELELTSEELAGIQDLDRRFVDAYNHLDVDAFMNCLWNSPNLV
jgi:hypothetical protein